MKDIKYRGLCTEDGELKNIFVYGDLVQSKVPLPIFEDLEYPLILTGSSLEDGSYSVDPKTVGQFTGLKDKNGVEVYEGDVIELTSEFEGSCDDIFDLESFHYRYTGDVKYMPSMGFYLRVRKCYDIDNLEYREDFCTRKSIVQYRSEVVGNIHTS